MAAKKIVLVTGGNVGIGFELVSQLMQKGSYHVLLAARSADKGEKAVKDLQSRSFPGTVEFLQLDVTNDSSIKAAADTVGQKHGYLDLLVNNAGVAPATQEPLRDNFRLAFETNAAGPAILTIAMIDYLRKSPNQPARILNVSSGAGSIGRYADPATPRYTFPIIHYQASKAALGMITVNQFREYGEEGIKVFGYCPGFTQSNLNAGTTAANGAKPASEAALPMVDILEGKRDAESGKFLTIGGKSYPW